MLLAVCLNTDCMFGTGCTIQGLNPSGSKSLYQTTVGPTQPPVQWVPGPSPGGKAAGAWC